MYQNVQIRGFSNFTKIGGLGLKKTIWQPWVWQCFGKNTSFIIMKQEQTFGVGLH
jgi:hypothetical protein